MMPWGRSETCRRRSDADQLQTPADLGERFGREPLLASCRFVSPRRAQSVGATRERRETRGDQKRGAGADSRRC